ncbi:aspartate aminotransferase family protein [Streptomyces sp. CBMA123]|uniref:aminotransferase family protein n=1 Tax=Streptomyces sp. CBMA123 TaxID=1896313 RepID=UPI001661E5C4|nr:aminotransferase class III-fold pyridoxal phosphate-dependent enzyme [Streptomyces sp. CBMA123]MBD0692474.1 aminotransferase class-III [Streptomyces sp. CBMA123]
MSVALPSPVRRADTSHLWHPWSPIRADAPRLVLTSGEGCRVTDDTGRTYLDLRAGTLNAILGYGERRVVDAISRQAGQLMTWDLAEVTTEPAALLAERIAAVCPPPLSRTLFCNSGSEGIEAALKIARMFHWNRSDQERTVVASWADGYHGATTAGIAATGAAFRRDGAGPLPDGYLHLATPRCTGCATGAGGHECRIPGAGEWEAQIAAIGAHRVAAIVVEPVLSVGGVIVPPDGTLAELRALCDRHGILLIADEVATGIGRTGHMLGFQHDLAADASPDIVVTSKGLAGGYAPLAAVTVHEGVYEAFAGDPYLGGLRHGHTTGGHATACAAALAVLDIVEGEGLPARAAAVGSVVQSYLSKDLVGCPVVRQVRGRGLLIGVETASIEAAQDVATLAQQAGVLVRSFGPVLTIAPPLVIDEEDALAGARTVADALHAVAGGAR